MKALVTFATEFAADGNVRKEFARRPAAVFEKYGVTVADQTLWHSGDDLRLSQALGSDVLKNVRAARDADLKANIHDQAMLYPGLATLTITDVGIEREQGNALLCTITVTFSWDELNMLPQEGLPDWGQVRIYDAATKKEVKGTPNETCVVPSLLDFDNRRGRMKRKLLFDKPGTYTVVVDTSGSREVLPSTPVAIEI